MTGAGRKERAFISKSADNDIVAVCLSRARAACRETHCLVITRLTHCTKMEINYRKQSLISTFRTSYVFQFPLGLQVFFLSMGPSGTLEVAMGRLDPSCIPCS